MVVPRAGLRALPPVCLSAAGHLMTRPSFDFRVTRELALLAITAARRARLAALPEVFPCCRARLEDEGFLRVQQVIHDLGRDRGRGNFTARVAKKSVRTGRENTAVPSDRYRLLTVVEKCSTRRTTERLDKSAQRVDKCNNGTESYRVKKNSQPGAYVQRTTAGAHRLNGAVENTASFTEVASRLIHETVHSSPSSSRIGRPRGFRSGARSRGKSSRRIPQSRTTDDRQGRTKCTHGSGRTSMQAISSEGIKVSTRVVRGHRRVKAEADIKCKREQSSRVQRHVFRLGRMLSRDDSTSREVGQVA